MVGNAACCTPAPQLDSAKMEKCGIKGRAMAQAKAAISVMAGLIGQVAPMVEASPSHSAQGGEIYEIGLSFADEAARGLLPPVLRPLPGASGGIAAYRLAGHAPVTFGYVWLDVQGHVSASGAAARYVVGGWHSPVAAVLSETVIQTGAAQITAEDGLVRFAAGDGTAGIGFALEPAARGAAPEQAVTHYIHDGHRGLWLVAVPIAFDWSDAAPVDADARALIGGDGVTGVTWAGVARNVRFLAPEISRLRG